MKKNIHLLFILLFIFSYIVKTEAKIDYNNLTFKNIKHSDGLTNTSINCIFEDSIGYLWFGSKTSLQKYYGEKLLYFPKELAPNIKINTNNVGCIEYKNSNFYFLFKNRLTIFNVKNNNIKIFRNKDYFIKKWDNNFLNKCIIDKENNLWISTDKGLFKSIKRNGKIKSFKLITLDKDDPQLQTLALYQDKYDNIWIGTKKGVYVYNLKENRTLNLTEKTWEIQPYSVSSIKEDKEGNIWVGQTKRLVKFSNKQNVISTDTLDINIYLFPDDNSFNYVSDFDFDTQGNIWVLKPHMINILEFKNNSYKIYNIKYNSKIKNGLNSNNFNCIKINKHGIVFIGTKEGEIDFFNPYIKKIENIKPLNYNDNFNINCICKDYNNNLWISVNFNKLFYYIPKENRFIPININRGVHIKNIIETKNHEIFFSSMVLSSGKGGLFRLNNTTLFYKTHNPKDLSLKLFNSLNIKDFNKENNSCFHTIQDIDSSFWFVAVKRGLFHFKYDGENFSLINHFSNDYFKKQKLNNVFIENINILKDSSLIIASTCDKLIKYNRDKKSFEEIKELRKSINQKEITDFTFSYLDSKERLWVGTEGNGILRYNRKKDTFKIFNKQNGLNSNNIYSFSLDKEKRMWLYTSVGITIIDSNDKIFNINQNGKFASPATNLHSKTKLNDSIFYMGNKNGLFHLNTKKIINQIDTIDSSIGINNIKINGNSLNEIKKDKNPINYDYIDSIKLEHNQKNINITFSSLSFSNRNSIKYRLLPIQKEWKNGDYGNNNFTINNLKRGNYTLECRSINKNGITSTITKQINITIKKAIYQKAWFIFCIFLFIITSLYLIHLIFKRHIKNKNKQLEKLIQTQTIKLLNNNNELEEKSKELTSKNKTRTTLFSVIAHDLLGPLGTIKNTNNLLTESYEDFKENDMLKGLLASNSESLSSLYELLQNLLFWSKHQQSDIKPNPTLFNLNDLCQKIFSFLKFTLSSKKNILIFDIPKDFNIYADKQMIHTILRNIISNSNKFTNNGTITVTAKEKIDFISISIKDTGVGMSKEKANKLFSNNNIFSTQGTAGETGTGLGLKVSKDFILKHHGKIHAESIENKGTIITFTISKSL